MPASVVNRGTNFSCFTSPALLLQLHPSGPQPVRPPQVAMLNGETSNSAARNVVRSSSISGEMYNIEKSNGGNSDSASLSSTKKRRSSLGAKMVAIVGLSQWSRSTMQLNHPGKKLHGTTESSLCCSTTVTWSLRRSLGWLTKELESHVNSSHNDLGLALALA